jgi:hypothetical protein
VLGHALPPSRFDRVGKIARDRIYLFKATTSDPGSEPLPVCSVMNCRLVVRGRQQNQ